MGQAICPLCQRPLGKDGIDWDHAIPLALGGEDRPSNIRAVHRECHRIKTTGPSKATAAGGDIHKAAKTKRLTQAQEVFRAALLAKRPAFLAADHADQAVAKPVRKIASRPFPKRPHERRTQSPRARPDRG